MIKNKAFTLIELLVVVAIIGILAAVGVVAYNGYTSSAKKAVVKQNHKTVVFAPFDLLSSKFVCPSEHFIISDCMNLVIVLC